MILETKRKATEEEPEPEPSKATTKSKKYSLALSEDFISEVKNDKKNISAQMFEKKIFYRTPLFLAKDLYGSNQIRNY